MGVISDFLYTLFPRLCLSCSNQDVDEENIFCIECLADIPYTDHFEIARNRINEIFYGRVELKFGASLLYFSKNGTIQNLLHEFKYKKKKEVGRVLGRQVGKKLVEKLGYDAFDLILPVPLHPLKEAKRGYNQSAVIAESIAWQLRQKPSLNIITKIKNTESQTRKTRLERMENVTGTFRLMKAEAVRGKHILIVDDVLTTGATIEECAKCLLKGGAESISVIVIAVGEL
jgi:ComF family protein